MLAAACSSTPGASPALAASRKMPTIALSAKPSPAGVNGNVVASAEARAMNTMTLCGMPVRPSESVTRYRRATSPAPRRQRERDVDRQSAERAERCALEASVLGMQSPRQHALDQRPHVAHAQQTDEHEHHQHAARLEQQQQLGRQRTPERQAGRRQHQQKQDEDVDDALGQDRANRGRERDARRSA